MIWNFSALEPVARYRLMIQSIVPRPIAWTLSRNEGGNFNLAPFSYFNAVHSNPPLLMMSVGFKKDKSKKDTRANIEREKQFVVHIAQRQHAPLVTQTADPLPYGDSEVEAAGLKLVPFEGFALPRLAAAPIAFGCRLDQVIEVGKNRQGLIFGEIEQLYVADDILGGTPDRPLIDALKLAPLCRLGGDDYGALGEVFTVDRPEYTPH